MTARTHVEDEEAKKSLEELDDDDEEFLEAYRRQRMNEIADTYQKAQNSKTSKLFGEFVQLTRETFLEAVDNEDPSVTVIVLITGESTRKWHVGQNMVRSGPFLRLDYRQCVIRRVIVSIGFLVFYQSQIAAVVGRWSPPFGFFLPFIRLPSFV